MAVSRVNRRDPLFAEIEGAFRTGRAISYRETDGFLAGLEIIHRRIAAIVPGEAARAAALLEAFLAGYEAHAELMDDSDGLMGTFAERLVSSWIAARQSAGAPADETVAFLMARMENDAYGLYNEIETVAAAGLDAAGLGALEAVARERLKTYSGAASSGASALAGRQILRTLFKSQGRIDEYIALCRGTVLTAHDCREISAMHEAAGNLNDALSWVEQGIAEEQRAVRPTYRLHELQRTRRRLLAAAGRNGEAFDEAWSDFEASPGWATYAEAMRYTEQSDRTSVHERAMAIVEERAELGSALQLWLDTGEVDRLVRRLGTADVIDLERISHGITEPAAKAVSEAHPELAAKLHRALGMRIVRAGKSTLYMFALAHLAEAKRCYEAAGDVASWAAFAEEVRRDHRRKSGFMPGFEAILQGRWAPPRWFLEEALDRPGWRTEPDRGA